MKDRVLRFMLQSSCSQTNQEDFHMQIPGLHPGPHWLTNLGEWAPRICILMTLKMMLTKIFSIIVMNKMCLYIIIVLLYHYLNIICFMICEIV